MKFKQPRLQDELYRADTSVQVMATWFEHLSLAHFGIEPTVTRVFDDIKGATGVHPAGRAVDIRSEYWGADGKKHQTYTPEQIRFLVSEVNRRFPRTDNKKSCIHHSFNGGPYHFHLQSGVAGVTRDLGAHDCDENKESPSHD